MPAIESKNIADDPSYTETVQPAQVHFDAPPSNSVIYMEATVLRRVKLTPYSFSKRANHDGVAFMVVIIGCSPLSICDEIH